MRKSSEVKEPKVVFQGFANVSLTKQRKQDVKQLVAGGVDYDRWFEGLTHAGYKVSVSWVESQGYFSATAFQSSPKSSHAGWGTTARHADLGTTIATLFYQVTVVLEEEGWPEENNNYEW